MNKILGMSLTSTALALFNPFVANVTANELIQYQQKQRLSNINISSQVHPQNGGISLSKLPVSFYPLKSSINLRKARVNHSSSSSIIGTASWYGPGFEGRLCANGEVFNPNDLTAAHPNLPFDTRVRVTNLNNGRSVVVRINDRGPYEQNRIIDLSQRAAQEIGMLNHGVTQVRLDIL
jgi:rare lipoprotein A (peptidoglycan hydrolase)